MVIEQPFEAAAFRRPAVAGIAEQSPSTPEPGASSEREPLRTIVQILRELLAEQNVAESDSADEEGCYFVVEGQRGVSVHCHRAEERDATSLSSWRLTQIGFSTCGNNMAARGYTTTLFMSPRTLALHVSD